MTIGDVARNFWSDVRLGARGLLKNPGFLVVVILSLAVGIAANSTIFSVLNALLHRPMPFPDPNRLVVIWQVEKTHPESRQGSAIAENLDWKKQNRVFTDIALISNNDSAVVSGIGEPRPLQVLYATPNLFNLLGAKPVLGRVYTTEEAQDLVQSIVISTPFWKQQYHSDPQVLGKPSPLKTLFPPSWVSRPRASPRSTGNIWTFGFPLTLRTRDTPRASTTGSRRLRGLSPG